MYSCADGTPVRWIDGRTERIRRVREPPRTLRVGRFLTKNSESFDTVNHFVKDFTFKSTKTSPRRQTVLTVTDWRELSACRDSDPDIFFPVGTTGPAVGLIDKATTICMACSVVEECLLYALETNQEAGVWGGLPEDNRRRFRKRWLAERRRRRQAS